MSAPSRKTTGVFFRSKIFLAGLLVAAFLVAIAAGREWYANYLTQSEIQKLEEQSRELEARRLELLDLVKKYESGEFIEREARVQLGLQRPGESVLVVQPSNRSSQPIVEEKPRSNPQRWRDYFIKR